MEKRKFLFGIHCHQPLGSPEENFEKAYKKGYLPFVQALDNHPRIKSSLYYSGVLYDWFLKKHPEFIDLLKKLIRRRQIEILSGGYYQPFLSLIPDDDKVGQIETANEFIKEKLGFVSRGMWLADKDWEPCFPKVISPAAVEYALAPFSGEDPGGYYVTEEQGQILKVFLIPEKKPEEVIENLKALAADKDVLTLFVAGDGQGEGLVEKLEENSGGLQFVTFSDYLDENSALGRIYLPSASGELKDSLTKDAGANNLHKKMLYVSSRLHTLRKGKILIGEAVRNLYQGQCGDAYEHEDSKSAVYSHLIRAETEIEKHTRGSKAYVDLSIMDFDKDGNDEVILSNDLMSLYFSPACGGTLFELDYKPRALNLLNTLGFSFIDHFYSPLQKESGNFVGENYTFMPKRSGREVSLALSKNGIVDGIPVKIEKHISLCARQSIINIEYLVTNLGEAKDEFWLGVEFNFSVKDKDLLERKELKKVAALKIVDEGSGIELSLEAGKPALVWADPVEKSRDLLILPSWKFSLGSMQTWKVSITLRIEE